MLACCSKYDPYEKYVQWCTGGECGVRVCLTDGKDPVSLVSSSEIVPARIDESPYQRHIVRGDGVERRRNGREKSWLRILGISSRRDSDHGMDYEALSTIVQPDPSDRRYSICAVRYFI